MSNGMRRQWSTNEGKQQTSTPPWNMEVKVWWLGIILSYGMMATSDETFAAYPGMAHTMHDMIRSGAVFSVRQQYTGGMYAMAMGQYDRRLFQGTQGWPDRGFKRTRADTGLGWGSWSSVRADGGTVAHIVELVPCFSGLPGHSPLSSYVVTSL